MEDDLYEILGVLPSAEDIVITAAYRVLAQRYHPDRWAGPPAEAHERMAAINRAYETLKDPARRAAYDGQRSKKDQASYERQQDQGREEVFSQAINDLEARWKIAADVFPDLNTLRAKLAKLSSALAFSFVTVMLEKKAFNDRQALAERMQDMFLGRYFGTDPKIKDVARDLILAGQRDAAKTLNELVDVMGSAVPAATLMERVHSTYGDMILERGLQGVKASRVKASEYDHFKRRFSLEPTVRNLRDLCETVGYSVGERGQGLFKSVTYEVSLPTGKTIAFHSKEGLLGWGLHTFK
jgi:DnaJ-domain-containing protein 1